MRLGTKTISMAASLLAVAGGLAAAAPAQAVSSYNIMISTQGTTFSADYCLLTTTSGNVDAECKKVANGADFRLPPVPYNAGDAVWMDINIVLGDDKDGIALQNMHYITVRGSVFKVQVCGWPTKAAYDQRQTGKSLHGAGTCTL
ncbi:hypothetical protein [Streptomyces zaomyceticus]|uniref:hypothetical protein n=1 Tax=Streptomyces zaomyceticus TaxID=68286 RepID=UPI00368C5348